MCVWEGEGGEGGYGGGVDGRIMNGIERKIVILTHSPPVAGGK